MSALSYRLLAGEFVIRYPDLPRGGPEPDGDTVKFAPDTPELVGSLPRVSGHGPDLNPRGISVRLEAIDALETHFSGAHQRLDRANAARDELLSLLGFSGVTFWPDLPNKVERADRDRVRGHVLSNGIDANGRMIGFVYPGAPSEPDGAEVFLDEQRAALSANAQLLAAGHAYPAFYGTLPAALRTAFAELSRAARSAGLGLWPDSTADPDGPAHVAGLGQLQLQAIWPKLFRRVAAYFAAGFTDFDGFDAWLGEDPVDRDDALFRLDRLEAARLHDVVRAEGDSIQLELWPEDFVVSPDPAPPGPSGPPAGGADALIVAALPDAAGADAGAESVTLLNVSASVLDLSGLALSDGADGRQELIGIVDAGATARIPLTGAVRLGNEGDTIRLSDARGTVIDEVAYQPEQVRAGRSIAFGR